MTEKKPYEFDFLMGTDFQAKKRQQEGISSKDLDTVIDDEYYDTGKPYRKRIVALKK